jgi:hypothetical protein
MGIFGAKTKNYHDIKYIKMCYDHYAVLPCEEVAFLYSLGLKEYHFLLNWNRIQVVEF